MENLQQEISDVEDYAFHGESSDDSASDLSESDGQELLGANKNNSRKVASYLTYISMAICIKMCYYTFRGQNFKRKKQEGKFCQVLLTVGQVIPKVGQVLRGLQHPLTGWEISSKFKDTSKTLIIQFLLPRFRRDNRDGRRGVVHENKLRRQKSICSPYPVTTSGSLHHFENQKLSHLGHILKMLLAHHRGIQTGHCAQY